MNDKVVRYRKGKPVLFDRKTIQAIKRWRERKQKLKLERLAEEMGLEPKGEMTEAHAKVWNLFSDEQED